MTTKVVKGSMWTLAGQIAPLFATLVSTPITIRLLGSEGYGVLLLVGLVPMYFSFADLGMGVASTRFGAAAYAEGDSQREAKVIWTAASIALLTSLLFVTPIFILSNEIVDFLNVPSAFKFEGAVALRITLVTFVLNLLGNIFNTPQLARLRMGVNSIIMGGARILVAIGTPVALLLGFGIIGAAIVGLAISITALVAHFIVSGRLVRDLLNVSIDRSLVSPMLKFGTGLFIAGIAVAFLANFEKLTLPRLVSIEALAFYSVAFTFASMATMYSTAMIQSLVPAFSQLQRADKRSELQALFSRSIRINLIILLPAMMILFVIAKPFFTFWAGEQFGRESSFPFHILLVGLLFNLIAYIPHGALTAAGRTDIFAKLYWIEAVIFVLAVIVLVGRFQIIGAALAWSLRVIVDACLITWLSKKNLGLQLGLGERFRPMVTAALVLLPPVLFAGMYDNFSLWLVLIVLACCAFYTFVIWQVGLIPEERTWLKQKLTAFQM